MDFKLLSISNTKQIQWFINGQLQVFTFHSFTADEKYWLHSIRKYFEMFLKRPPIILLGVYLSLADSVQRDLQNIYINWWSYNFVECVDKLLNKQTSIAYTIHTDTHTHAQICKGECAKMILFCCNSVLILCMKLQHGSS